MVVDKDKLQINCGNYNTQIKGGGVAEFPTIPTIKKEKGCKINSSILKEALQQVLFAASISDIRPEISGIFFFLTGEKVVLAATDSYRLAEKNLGVSPIGQNDEDVAVIIPLKAAQEILRILSLGEDVLAASDEDGESVNLYIGDNQILFESNNTELISKLVEGQYPDYKQIIPQDFKTNIIINRNIQLRIYFFL